MGTVLAVLAGLILAQSAPGTPPAETPPPEIAPPETIAAPTPEPAPLPEELAPPPLPPPEPPAYGYAGMSELSLALGYSSVSGSPRRRRVPALRR